LVLKSQPFVKKRKWIHFLCKIRWVFLNHYIKNEPEFEMGVNTLISYIESPPPRWGWRTRNGDCGISFDQLTSISLIGHEWVPILPKQLFERSGPVSVVPFTRRPYERDQRLFSVIYYILISIENGGSTLILSN
jgi:hypothetical protein